MAYPEGSIPLTSSIGTTGESDTFATHLAELGRGGIRTVQTIADRDAITEDRREFGMLVVVEENATTYQLQNTALGGINDDIEDNTNWNPYSVGTTQNLEETLQEGNTTNTDIVLINEASVVIEGTDPVTRRAYMNFADSLAIQSTNEGFTFNDKNIVRSVVGVEADINGDVPEDDFAEAINAKQIPLPYKFKLIAKYTPNPDDSDSNSGGRYFDYETDSLRTFDLQDYITAVGGTSNAIISDITKVRNNIILSIELNDNFHQRGVLLLKDCYIVNNILNVTSFQYKELTDLRYKDGADPTHEPYSLHSEVIVNDYIYYISRNNTMSGAYDGTAPQIFKLNVNNLDDYSYVDLPNTTGYLGEVGEIDFYQNKLYFIARVSQSGGSYICTIDTDLANPQSLIQIGLSSSYRIPSVPPFVIYEGEIYIPTNYSSGSPANVAYNTIGIQVYDIAKKTITRQVNQLPVTTGITSGTLVIPHWVTVFGGKIILHTGTGSNPLSKTVVRIDAKTLALEESFNLNGQQYSNDNFITEDGYVELYPESNSGNYYRFFYKDFAGTATIVDSLYYALGCPQYPVEKEKAILNLSDLNNDISIPGTTNLSYTASPTNGIVNSDTGTDATIPLADATNAGLESPVNFTKLSNLAANANTAYEPVQSGTGLVTKSGTTTTYTPTTATATSGSTSVFTSGGAFTALALKANLTANTFTSTQTFATNLVPSAAGTRSVGTASLPFSGMFASSFLNPTGTLLIGTQTASNTGFRYNDITVMLLTSASLYFAVDNAMTFGLPANRSSNVYSVLGNFTGEVTGITPTVASSFATKGYVDGLTLTATATLDFGSTAAGMSSDLTITVTGAVLGDVVTLGVPNASIVANTSYFAWVSATDTVTVRHNNYSALPTNPASGSFKVKVLK